MPIALVILLDILVGGIIILTFAFSIMYFLRL